MKTIARKTTARKCRLTLPVFEAENKSENDTVRLMNCFTDKLEEKIISYSSSDGKLRMYSADFSTSEEKGTLHVCFALSARLIDSDGAVVLRKKSLVCKWKKTKLVSVVTL